MFERTHKDIGTLQTAYERWRPGASKEPVLRAHRQLLGCSTALFVESALAFAKDDALTGMWSELGTEGAMALVKAVELANHHDPEGQFLSPHDRCYLLTWAALEAYRCGRHGISAAILKRNDAGLPTHLAPSASLVIAQVLQALGRARLETTWSAVQNARAEVIRQVSKVQGQDHSWNQVAGWLATGALCNALEGIQAHLASGERGPMEGARTWLDRALRLAESSRDNDIRIFLESIERAFTSLRKLSIWQLVTTVWPEQVPPNVVAWAKHRIRRDRAFLFPSQYESLIRRRLLSQTRALVSLPTGGGKSLLAEVFALRVLASDPTAKVLLIVPSRALAAEKREELQDGLTWPGSPFTVCQLSGDVPLDAEEAITENNVTVLTPEKFDIVLRSDFFPTLPLGALLVDEFHMLRASYRGIKLQLSLVRFRERFPSIPSLFISAIVRGTDFEALSHWAHAPDPFSSDWKPTPSRIGLVDLCDRPLMTLNFNDGIVRRIEISPTIRRNAAEQASVPLLQDLVTEDQVLYFQLYWRSYEGNHLYKVAEEILNKGLSMAHLDMSANAVLAARLERLAGKEEPMLDFFRKGVGLHWGMLPQAARRLIEEGIRQRALGLVLATSTLAEGVNLPIKTVYVRKLATRHHPLEMSTFLNVVGRAGRPFFHPEGQVVIGYCESGSGKTLRADAERYAAMDRDQLEALITAAVGAAKLCEGCARDGLFDLATLEPIDPSWEDRHRRRGLTNPVRTGIEQGQDRIGEVMAEVENLSGALLAALVEGQLLSLAPSDLLAEALFLGPELLEDRERVWRFVAAIRKRLVRVNALVELDGRDEVTPWGHVIYKTGFGPGSCVRLRDRLVFLDESPSRIRWQELLSHGGNANRLWRHTKILLTQPYERWKMDREPRKALNMYLLGGWAAGISLDEVRRQMRTLQDRELAEAENRLYLDVFTEVEGLLAAWSAWVFYALAQIAEYRLPQQGWGARFEELARIVLYGHWNGPVRQVLRRDLTGRILRDDLVLLFETGGERLIRRILGGDVDREELLALLRGRSTRLPPDELADLLLAVATSPGR